MKKIIISLLSVSVIAFSGVIAFQNINSKQLASELELYGHNSYRLVSAPVQQGSKLPGFTGQGGAIGSTGQNAGSANSFSGVNSRSSNNEPESALEINRSSSFVTGSLFAEDEKRNASVGGNNFGGGANMSVNFIASARTNQENNNMTVAATRAMAISRTNGNNLMNALKETDGVEYGNSTATSADNYTPTASDDLPVGNGVSVLLLLAAIFIGLKFKRSI